jgi:hypothetical protein
VFLKAWKQDGSLVGTAVSRATLLQFCGFRLDAQLSLLAAMSGNDYSPNIKRIGIGTMVGIIRSIDGNGENEELPALLDRVVDELVRTWKKKHARALQNLWLRSARVYENIAHSAYVSIESPLEVSLLIFLDSPALRVFSLPLPSFADPGAVNAPSDSKDCTTNESEPRKEAARVDGEVLCR